MTSVESKAETQNATEDVAPQGVAPGTVEQEQFFSLLKHVQRGRMEEQRCLFDPNKKIPCTPKHTDATHTAPNSLPVLHVASANDLDGQREAVGGKETDQLCNMVSRVQGSRMDEQRSSAPQIFLTPGSPVPPRKAHSRPPSPSRTPSNQTPPRSASFSPASDTERVQRDGKEAAQQGEAPGTVEQEQFFSLLKYVQRGRMDEQRCLFDPNKSIPCTPKHSYPTTSGSTHPPALDNDQLFSLLANTQSRRLDDQRLSISLLPGFQGSRMDEQQCMATQIFLTPGSPVPPRRANSRPASPSRTPSNQTPPRSASFSPASDTERVQRDGKQVAQQGEPQGTVEQEQFFSLLKHVQRGRMEEQRCLFDPNKRILCTPKHTDATHTVTGSLPGLHLADGSDQEGLEKSVAGKETVQLCNMVSRVQGYRIDEQRCSLPVATIQMGLPRSAAMNGVTLDSSLPRQNHPLLSTPILAPPRKARSNPTSPSRATPRKDRCRPPSPNPVPHSNSLISPDEAYFSLIHRVHTSQLQMGGRDKGVQGRKEGGRERGRVEGGKREGKKRGEGRERRGKEEGGKERKAGGRKR